MAYLGSVPAPIPTNFQQVNAQSFNGDGSTVAFTLSRPVQYTKDIEVLVNNVQQNPYSGSYSVSSTTLTFAEAPSSGTNNVYVIFRDHPLTSINPADGSVTTAKIANGAVGADGLASTLDLSGKTLTLPAAAVTVHAPVSSVAGRTGAVALSNSDVSGLGALAALNTVGTSQIDDSAITNGKLAANGLDASKLTTGTLPIAQIADGSITQAKVNDNAGGLRPEWTEIRFAGLQATDSILETPNKIFINNGNNGSSARGRLQGSAKGVFRVRFELGYLWGWSEFILYPRDLWDAATSASIDAEPVGRTAIKIMNNSSNNVRIGLVWTGSGSTTQWLTQGGTTAVWTAWRDSSNDIRIFDGSTTTLVTNSSEEFVVVSGLQSPHYTRIYEAGSYK